MRTAVISWHRPDSKIEDDILRTNAECVDMVGCGLKFAHCNAYTIGLVLAYPKFLEAQTSGPYPSEPKGEFEAMGLVLAAHPWLTFRVYETISNGFIVFESVRGHLLPMLI